MATTVTITSSYAGEFAGKYISASFLLSANSLYNGGFTIRPNINFKEVLKNFTSTNPMADGTCDFTDTSDITLTEVTLTPKELQVNLELCKTPFLSDWESARMGYSAFHNMPPLFSDYLLAETAAKVAENVEKYVWNGIEGTAGQFGGVLTQLAANAAWTGTTNNHTKTPVTAANVITVLGAIVDKIPEAIYSQEDLKLYLAPNVVRAYVRALGGFGASGLGAQGVDNKGTMWYENGSLSFDGLPIFLAQGLTSNQIVAARTSNLFFGTGLMSDLQEVKTIDMADIDGSQNVRIIMRFTAGTAVGIPSEVVAAI